jgi:hypothetical protein
VARLVLLAILPVMRCRTKDRSQALGEHLATHLGILVARQEAQEGLELPVQIPQGQLRPILAEENNFRQ